MQKLYFKKFVHWQLIFILFVIGFLVVAYYQTKDENSNETLFCEVDADCTTTYFSLDACCQQCKIFPINAISLEQQIDMRSKECSSAVCPEYRCLWPVKEVKCIDKKCTLIDEDTDY